MEDYLTRLERFNSTPLEDFQGLTPNQMDILINRPYSQASPVQLKAGLSDKILNGIPYFRLTEELLLIIAQSGKLKLTATNSLPPKVIEELYSYKFIKDPLEEYRRGKQMRECDSEIFITLNITTRYLPFIKRQRGEFVFTIAGIEWLKTRNRELLLKELLKIFTGKFNWGYNDGFPELPIGQLGWAYTIFLLLKYGATQKPVKFYSDLYFKAFPQFIEQYPIEKHRSREEGSTAAFIVRNIDRFLEWYGLVEVSDCNFLISKAKGNVQPTEILYEVFEIYQ